MGKAHVNIRSKFKYEILINNVNMELDEKKTKQKKTSIALYRSSSPSFTHTGASSSSPGL